jgi:phosphomannomutase
MDAMTCFKAYDIRGRLGVDLDEGLARRIGRAFARTLPAARVVVGHDCRLSSPGLAAAVTAGLVDEGVEVLSLGLCGTEEVYFATSHLRADGGICVTASHNPADWNGMKMVRAGSAPVGQDSGQDTGLAAMARMAAGDMGPAAGGGRVAAVDTRAAYVDRVLSFVDLARLRPLHVVVNGGNGAAGPTFDAVADVLAARGAPLRFTRIHHAPDGHFPNGIPNPLLAENQPVTADAVRAAGADLGVAWDGDFDRCFLFDATGAFVPGEYVVGLLAEVFLQKEPGATIVHDPRVVLGTRAAIAAAGGVAHQARTGHAFLKAALRETGAVYGGEMSAHHYFRDFMACDSGMIPWLLVAELMGRTGQPLSALLAARRAAFPSSGEINFRVADAAAAVDRVRAAWQVQAVAVDEMDGLSLTFPGWRFNLRSSNTEPLLRLNVEARGDAGLVAAQVAAISALIGEGGG